jgi:glycyl-tRNA synthetase
VKRFNLMFLTAAGAEAGEPNMGLRPETTQGSAVEFRRCYMVMRGKLPFVIAQLGHVFRNEISPRRGLIRMREFQQLEVHVFFDPEDMSPYDKKLEPYLDYKLRFLKLEDADTGKIRDISAKDALKSGYTINELITYWLVLYQRFFSEVLGFPLERLRYRELGPDERAHYAKAHWDLEVYSEEIGWVELVNNAYRTDYDLKGHIRESGVDLTVQTDGKKVLPHLYEPSIGLDRTIFFELLLSYRKDERVWMQLPRNLAPFEAAVFPLLSKQELVEKAKEVEKRLSRDFDVFYDDRGSIGRRYRRMDEIGTPACITIDYQTLEDETVTIRDRDTMQQIRVKIEELPSILREFLSGKKLEELGEFMER